MASFRRLPLLAAALFAAAASAGPRPALGGDETPPSPSGETRPSVDASIAALRSPFYSDRESAIADLVAWGAKARGPVLAGFREGSLDVRPALVRVLAADASPEALDALLEALPAAKDAATTFAIEMSLVDHAERVGDAVRKWHAGSAPPRVAELAALLDRARVEGRFLAKKSASGGTGSYPGQFEDLAEDVDRFVALDVCLGILKDQALKLPGRYPTGAYRFLRAPPFFVSRDELREMSIHAVSELANPGDQRVIDELIAARIELERVIGRKERLKVAIEAALSDSILATLAKLRPDDAAKTGDRREGGFGTPTWMELAREKIDELRSSWLELDDAAALALQLHDFALAVELYRQLDLRQDGGAIASYNLACAYARWSLAPGDESPARLRARALAAITKSVARGYADWSWMEQDRDLDPIRAEPAFRLLVQRMKASFTPKTRAPKPGEPAPGDKPGSKPAPPEGEQPRVPPVAPPPREGGEAPGMGDEAPGMGDVPPSPDRPPGR